jgi:hypothetical protein
MIAHSHCIPARARQSTQNITRKWLVIPDDDGNYERLSVNTGKMIFG